MELRIAEIMRILPHRYPFLLVDRVIEADPDRRIVALKNVSINEPFFNGHFPGAPILPGVAQVDWAIAFARERFAMPARFIRMEALKFSQPALPGMHLDLELHWNAEAATLQFEYRSTTGRHSSGRVVFAAREAA